LGGPTQVPVRAEPNRLDFLGVSERSKVAKIIFRSRKGLRMMDPPNNLLLVGDALIVATALNNSDCLDYLSSSDRS
jgi:hypothetical protein